MYAVSCLWDCCCLLAQAWEYGLYVGMGEEAKRHQSLQIIIRCAVVYIGCLESHLLDVTPDGLCPMKCTAFHLDIWQCTPNCMPHGGLKISHVTHNTRREGREEMIPVSIFLWSDFFLPDIKQNTRGNCLMFSSCLTKAWIENLELNGLRNTLNVPCTRFFPRIAALTAGRWPKASAAALIPWCPSVGNFLERGCCQEWNPDPLGHGVDSFVDDSWHFGLGGRVSGGLPDNSSFNTVSATLLADSNGLARAVSSTVCEILAAISVPGWLGWVWVCGPRTNNSPSWRTVAGQAVFLLLTEHRHMILSTVCRFTV